LSTASPEPVIEPEALGRLDVRRPGFWKKRGWYSKNTKFYPLEPWLFYGDLTDLIREYVLPGHAPGEPLLRAQDRVITLGSCFAQELRSYLERAGFSADAFRVPEGLNNTFAILDFVSWCVTGKDTGRGFRYDTTPDGDIAEWKLEESRELVHRHLREAGAFVFTLGLAEVWRDRESGAVFWRGVPKDVYDEHRHVFTPTTVEENERNVLQAIELIRRVNPVAPIVLTLSPVPLKATFREISCLTADCVSKSTLRVALDRVVAHRLENVYYWPSYEIVRWVGGHLPWPAYGFNRGDSRHVTRFLVAKIIDSFMEAFYTPEAVAELRARGGWASSFERSPRSLRARAAELRRKLAHDGRRKLAAVRS
jgi:GSCFA family protein